MNGKRYGVYSKFKPSQDGWLGDIPAHWTANRLKFLANAFASNVDKKSKDGELPVKLCNYTDVYYNDVVCPDLPFMEATATPEQIEKFALRAGDTIITKDSEDPNDIAVPAFVEQNMPDVICGYHLAMIRPTPIMSPPFLSKTFQCAFARAYFATRSNGLTRYGLGGQALGSVVFPVPPLAEQTQIAKFLDYETGKIDALIEKQRQLIALLKEKRQAVISHAVTKGLNPDSPMRDSGVEWLGEVPAHWEVKKLRYFAQVLRGKFTHRPRNDPAFYDGPFPFVQTGDITGASKYITAYRQTLNARGASVSKEFPKGTLVMAIAANIGDVAILDFPAYFPDSVVGLLPNSKADVMFMYYMMQAMKQPMLQRATISTQMNLNIDQISWLTSACPPVDEQRAIAKMLDAQLARMDALHDKMAETIVYLQERRTALISAAVTGKIDVRGWTPPESETEEEAE